MNAFGAFCAYEENQHYRVICQEFLALAFILLLVV